MPAAGRWSSKSLDFKELTNLANTFHGWDVFPDLLRLKKHDLLIRNVDWGIELDTYLSSSSSLGQELSLISSAIKAIHP